MIIITSFACMSAIGLQASRLSDDFGRAERKPPTSGNGHPVTHGSTTRTGCRVSEREGWGGVGWGREGGRQEGEEGMEGGR